MQYPRQVWLEWRRQHFVKNKSPLDFDQSDEDVEDEERKKSFLCKIFDEAENKLTAKNFTSLKNNFLAFIYNTAEAYPGANFSFIFDAVNQFSSEKDAHDMWWIPQKTTEAPNNVNFVVSTLSTESGTFENAQKVANASIIKIENMPDQDLVRFLEVTLDQYNKKLTTKQVNNIVERASKSPLFLTAFCSDIRRAGIWEEVDLEIEKLILTSSANSVELNELLDDKQEKYNIPLSEQEKETLISRGGKNPKFLTALCSDSDKPGAKMMLNEAIDALLKTSNDAIEIREVSDINQECNTPVPGKW